MKHVAMSGYERIAHFEHVLKLRDAQRTRTRLIAVLTIFAVVATIALWH
jgi:hypothetical protein